MAENQLTPSRPSAKLKPYMMLQTIDYALADTVNPTFSSCFIQLMDSGRKKGSTSVLAAVAGALLKSPKPELLGWPRAGEAPDLMGEPPRACVRLPDPAVEGGTVPTRT